MAKKIAINSAVFSTLLLSSSVLYSADYSFFDINSPYGGGGTAFALGINNSNQIVGGAPGYMYQQGSFTHISVPNTTQYDVVNARGINNSGVIVGNYYATDNYSYGFISDSNGITTLNTRYTSINGINDNGVMVGGNGSGSFIYSNGNFTPFSDPDAFISMTSASGINNAGEIVGSYRDKSGFGDYGFLFNGSLFIKIAVPNTTYTQVTGINNKGQIVGYYEDFSLNRYRGFLFDGTNYLTIDYSGPGTNQCYRDETGAQHCVEVTPDTYISGINDNGVLVGSYRFGGGPVVGFYASPVPIPSTLCLFVTALLSIPLQKMKRKKMS